VSLDLSRRDYSDNTNGIVIGALVYLIDLFSFCFPFFLPSLHKLQGEMREKNKEKTLETYLISYYNTTSII
jgi:hypothetical protein